MKYLFATLAVAVSLAAGWFVYRASLEQTPTSSGKTALEPQPVELAQVVRRDVRERVERVGSLEPRADVTIRSRIRGYVTAVPFDVGDRIEPVDPASGGEPPTIVELEDSAPAELLRGAEAALQVARAQLAAKESQLAFARTTADRQQELARTGATSQQEIDQVQSQLAVAEAEVELEKARVTQALSEVERMRLDVKQTRMRAPLGGFVAERFVEVGDLANPDDPLLRIIDIATVHTIVSIVEQDYQRVKIGQTADVTIDAFPDRVFQGRVVRKSPVLDPETRMADVYVEIENSDGELKPGMYARVAILSGVRGQVSTIPTSALVDGQSTPSVFLVEEGQPPRVRIQKVEIGLQDGEHVEVLSGVGLNDHVVTLGSNLLEDGQPVLPLARQQVARSASVTPPGQEPPDAPPSPGAAGATAKSGPSPRDASTGDASTVDAPTVDVPAERSSRTDWVPHVGG